jgi:hypothetical protein
MFLLFSSVFLLFFHNFMKAKLALISSPKELHVSLRRLKELIGANLPDS